jgi:hypothetical protein
MSTQSTIRKVIAATAISAAIGLTSLVGGAASADGPSSSGKMVNVSSYILTNATVANTGASQTTLGAPQAPQQAGHEIREHVEFTYQKIIW